MGEAKGSLYDLSLGDQPVALVLGSEGSGLAALTRKRCDVLASIPQHGSLSSLNVSTAGAIACFDVARQRARPSTAVVSGPHHLHHLEAGTDQGAGLTERADVIVVGMGPGGEEVAGRLAEAGLDVVGVDAELVGGECPYWGCIPSKMMIRAADLLAEARRVPGWPVPSTVRPDWAPVARRIRDEATDNWDDTVAVERFEGKGGRLVRGWGRLEGPRRVAVGDRRHRGRPRRW